MKNKLHKMQIKIVKYVIFALGILLSTLAYADKVEIGLHAQFWPFMYKTASMDKLSSDQKLKWLVAEENVKKISELGAVYNYVNLRQNVDGPDNFVRAKKIVELHEKFNIEVIFRLIEDCSVYDELSDGFNEDYGYNEEYFLWIKAVAEKFKKSVKYYLISNEVDNNIKHNWNCDHDMFVSYGQYKKLIDTAYLAIKEIDSSLKVVDHGFGNSALGIATAYDIYNTKGVEEAYRFYNDFTFGQTYFGKNINNFKRLMEKTDSDERYRFIKDYFQSPPKCDYIQIHFYRNWRTITRVLQFIKDKCGAGSEQLKFIAPEVGYIMPLVSGTKRDGSKGLVPDYKAYSEEDHANVAVKSIVTLLANKVSPVIYHLIRAHHDVGNAARLFYSSADPEEFNPTKAAYAFVYLCDELQHQLIPENSFAIINGVVEAIFGKNNNISICWSYDDSPQTIRVPKDCDLVKVTDMYGNEMVRKDSYEIDANPVFFFKQNCESLTDNF